MSERKAHVLISGLEDLVWESLKPLFQTSIVTTLDVGDIEMFLYSPPDPTPCLILVGELHKAPPPIEMAQFVRMQFQETMLFFISQEPSQFKREDLLRNGFNDCFTRSLDSKLIEPKIQEALGRAGTIKSYRPVKLIDIQPETKLDFDLSIFLPVNNKYIKVTNAGSNIEKEKAEKLAKHNVTSVHVTHDQLKSFYSYSANQLKKISDSKELSETEKRDQLQGAVRNLIGGIVSASETEGTIDGGRSMIADCHKIIKNYIVSSEKGSWYQNVLQVAGDESNHYSHMSNVSTFCALFSMGTGIGNPEDMAVAGMMHDIGLAMVPVEIQAKPEESRTAVEQDEYKKHVEYTMDLIKQKKLILPEIILRAISQHHERFNEKGYPKALGGKRFSPEAQILALADEFDKLTRIETGKKKISPVEAIRKIEKEVQGKTSDAPFDPAIVAELVKLFPKK